MKKVAIAMLLVSQGVLAQTVFHPSEGAVPFLKNEGERRCLAVPNGTRVKVLEGPAYPEEVLGKRFRINFGKLYKIRVIEGECKGSEGWVLEAHLRP